MPVTIIQNARIINEGRSFVGSVEIAGERIANIREGEAPTPTDGARVIDATGKWLLPGAIDAHVHFREPGLTHKGDIGSESRVAVAGGVTSFMDMPNTQPPTVTLEQWQWKMERAAETSAANYAFFFGGTNDNIETLRQLDRRRLPGIKLFLTEEGLQTERIFSETDLLLAVHAEKEDIIRRNARHYGDNLDASFHPKIRSEEACYTSSSEAVALAHRTGARLHILHLSTAKELSLLEDNNKPLKDKKVTSEVCVHYLHFCDTDYATLGNRIKCNPAIKTSADRNALRDAVNRRITDIVSTDHAPHLLAEKTGAYLTAASGLPLVQHSLLAMLELAAQGCFPFERVVDMMAHRPADLFRIHRRGYLRPDYYADLTLVDPNAPCTVTTDNILYRCNWSPFDGHTFPHSIWKTFVNGHLAFSAGEIIPVVRGKAIDFL